MLMTRRFWLGLAITLGLLFLFLWKIDFEQTGRELRDANYAYYLPAVALYFLTLAFRSLRWRLLLLHLKPIPATRLYPIVAIGYLANNILPLRLGEFVRAHFLGDREGVSKASGLATIGMERVLDGLTLLLFAAVMWPLLPWTDVLRSDDGDPKAFWIAVSALVALGFVVGFGLLVLLAVSPRAVQRLASLLASLTPLSLRPKVEAVVYLLIDGLQAVRSPTKLAAVLVLSAPVWLTEAAVYYIIALSFDLDQPFQVILLMTATSNLATAVPSTIGGIGPFEVVAKSTLVAFGVTGEAAAAYAFFVHIVVLWLPVNILGVLFLWRENFSFLQLARNRPIDLSPDTNVDVALAQARTPARGVGEYDSVAGAVDEEKE